MPAEPLSAVVFFLFTPALVYDSLANSDLAAGLSLQIAAVAVIIYIVGFAAASAWSMLVRHEPLQRSAFALAVTSLNTGNMGIAVALLAFGEVGVQVAVLTWVVNATLVTSAGIVIATLPGGSSRRALVAPFAYPALYAAALGFAANGLDVDLPVTIEAPIATLADAAVPAMLVVLGLQLGRGLGDLGELADVRRGIRAAAAARPARRPRRGAGAGPRGRHAGRRDRARRDADGGDRNRSWRRSSTCARSS